MKRDSVYLAHILEEMEFLQTNFADRSCEEIVQNEMMKRSVLRSLEVIGEASKNLSSVVRARYPDIPWNGMARMRDRLIHGYFSVRWEIVLDVVQREIPAVEPEIRAVYSALLSEEAGSDLFDLDRPEQRGRGVHRGHPGTCRLLRVPRHRPEDADTGHAV
ncbi:MAG: DUF86 domain-containing protein, partial [Methanoculleus sp.]